MDYNNYNYNNRRSGNNNKRRAQSVQDMMNPSASARRSSRSRSHSRSGSYEPNDFSGGIDSLAGVIFIVLLCICVMAAILFYRNTRTSGYYPLNVVTINGVINEAYAGMPGAPSDAADQPLSTPSSGNAAGNTVSPTLPDTTVEPVSLATGVTGAAMLLDAGGGVEGYPEAASYAELLTQLETALSSGDANFIGSKIGYTDDSTGTTLGFPQSVVEHFASFMAANADKRQAFLDTIQDADKYAGTNGSAQIVNLPLISYKVTTDYDETTFSFSGFSEQTINANQEATVSPMLPCMYMVNATCPSWAQPIEGQLEATFGENLEVNFGTN
ncbi:MAG: hypothetical protein IJU25_03870 [Lachnospiraceae bacterium]|nr:hypothetical protein [Lachnospiraceae bacterium]